MTAEPRICAADGCETEFTPNRRGRPRIYCDACSTGAAYNRRWRKGETHAPPPRPYVRRLPREAVCQRCGDTYLQTAPRQLYCHGCGELVTVQCDHCGRDFEARARDRVNGGSRFCGKSCAMKVRRRELRPWPDTGDRQRNPATGRFQAAA